MWNVQIHDGYRYVCVYTNIHHQQSDEDQPARKEKKQLDERSRRVQVETGKEDTGAWAGSRVCRQ